MTDEPFGFTISRSYEPPYPRQALGVVNLTPGDDETKHSEVWTVSLPHQCGGWEVTGEYTPGVSRDEAIRLLRKFIEEATETHTALVRASPPEDKRRWSWSTDD